MSRNWERIIGRVTHLPDALKPVGVAVLVRLTPEEELSRLFAETGATIKPSLNHGSENARRERQLMLEHILHKNHSR